MQSVLALAPSIAKTSGFGSSADHGRVHDRHPRCRGGGRRDCRFAGRVHSKTYWLTGPGLITNYDVAVVLSKLLGRTITYRELSLDEDRDTVIRNSVPEPIAEMNAQALSMIADGDAEWVTDDVPSLVGRPARSFEQFAADYAPAFS